MFCKSGPWLRCLLWFSFSICSEPVHLLKQVRTFGIVHNAIPPSLWMSDLSGSIYLCRHKVHDLISVMCTLHMSKPSRAVLLNHQADWFQFQPFSELCGFISFFQCNVCKHLIVQFCVTLPQAPLSCLTDIYQTNWNEWKANSCLVT